MNNTCKVIPCLRARKHRPQQNFSRFTDLLETEGT
jgi:hypothetical protein